MQLMFSGLTSTPAIEGNILSRKIFASAFRAELSPLNKIVRSTTRSPASDTERAIPNDERAFFNSFATFHSLLLSVSSETFAVSSVNFESAAASLADKSASLFGDSAGADDVGDTVDAGDAGKSCKLSEDCPSDVKESFCHISAVLIPSCKITTESVIASIANAEIRRTRGVILLPYSFMDHAPRGI
jgi:hypothetical protein